jgi:hypothetical protein
MTTKTDDNVQAKMRAEKMLSKSPFLKVSKKEFNKVFPKLPKEFRKPKLSEKETLELARLDLRTACKRLEEGVAKMRQICVFLCENQYLPSLESVKDGLVNAWTEIERAGKGLK